uniref:Uncharacterized protein n=1 Tax=Romanomermis culicivorax TaxID=13658 RepID=A0A915JCY8_ROMCU
MSLDRFQRDLLIDMHSLHFRSEYMKQPNMIENWLRNLFSKKSVRFEGKDRKRSIFTVYNRIKSLLTSYSLFTKSKID